MADLSWQDVQRLNNIAFLNSQITCAMIEAMGMQAENQESAVREETPPYKKGDFDNVLLRYGIHHNEALETLRNGL